MLTSLSLALLLVVTPGARPPKAGKGAKKPAPAAKAAPAPEPAAAAVPPDVRADVAAVLKQAQALIADLDEDKAVPLLDAQVARADLTATEMAVLQMWRGVALLGSNKNEAGEAAFGLSRACNPLLEMPPGPSPKIKAAFKAAVPLDCPVKVAAAAADEAMEGLEFTLKDKKSDTPVATKQEQEQLYEGPSDAPKKKLPPPVAAPAATPEKKAEAGGGGRNVKALVGGAVIAALGGVLGLASVVGLAAGAGVLGASFPVWNYGNAQEKVVDYRRGLYAAFGMRVGGVAAFPVAGVVFLGGLVGGVVGAVVLVKGLLG